MPDVPKAVPPPDGKYWVDGINTMRPNSKIHMHIMARVSNMWKITIQLFE